MKKYIWIYSLITMAILVVAACKKDSNDDPSQSKMLGWVVGGSSYPSQYGTILNTTDGGITWVIQADSTQFPGAGLSDLCIIDKNTLLVVGDKKPDCTANVYKSVDGGASWESATNNSLKNVNYGGIYSLNKDNIWIVGDSGTIYHSTDIANSWTKIEVPIEFRDDAFLRVVAKSTDNIWVVGNKHAHDNYPIMIHSTDAGATWKRHNPVKDLDIDPALGGHFLGIKTYGNSIWAIGGFGEFVLRSIDNGTTWTDITSSLTGGGDANDIFLLSETEAYVAYDYGGIFSTSNSGQDWTEYYPGTNNWLVGISILDNINIWACGVPAGTNEYSSINYSSDAGTTWQEQTPQILKDLTNVSMYKIRFIEDN